MLIIIIIIYNLRVYYIIQIHALSMQTLFIIFLQYLNIIVSIQYLGHKIVSFINETILNVNMQPV